MTSRLPFSFVLLLVAALWTSAPAGAHPVRTVVPTVLGTIPHDTASYSEGLVFDGPALYEATGEVGRSQLQQLDPNTGRILRAADLPPTYFGEGIAVVGDRIWQLVYDNPVAIEWDRATFTPIREVPIAGQGWGLCSDGSRLVVSDGTDRLFFHDPDTMARTGAVDVTLDGRPLRGLDELECVDGQVWAAAWPDDEFVRVDPATGVVDTVLDTSNLWRFGARDARQVVSSIAHIGGDEYLISGKEWPESFRVRIPA